MDRVQELSASPKFIDANKHRYSHYYPPLKLSVPHITTMPKGKKIRYLPNGKWEIPMRLPAAPYASRHSKQRRNCLQLGHMTPDAFHISERVNTVAGRLPSQSIGHKARQDCRAYSWTDLVWDIEHGFLVVPENECRPCVKPGAYGPFNATAKVKAPHKANVNKGLQDCYWRVKIQHASKGRKKRWPPLRTSPQVQGSQQSAFAISILSIFKEIGGTDAMEAVKSAKEAPITKGTLKTVIIPAALRGVARKMWVKVLSGIDARHKQVKGHYSAKRLAAIEDVSDRSTIAAAVSTTVRAKGLLIAGLSGGVGGTTGTSKKTKGTSAAPALSTHLSGIPIGVGALSLWRGSLNRALTAS